MPKLCEFLNCKKRADFGYSEKPVIFCNEHKTDNMKRRYYSKCFCGKKLPSFNYENLKAKYCLDCKLDGMICVSNKECYCKKTSPTFNYEGLKAKYCSECKLDGMIDVNHELCKCGKRPSFNIEGLKPKFCSECKTDNMIDVVNLKKCFCKNTLPHYNYEGLKAEYCTKCKKDGMINVKDKRCFCLNSSNPCFNFEGLKPEYCSSCKKDDMIDVVNPRCFCGKSTGPSFNLIGLKPKYCSSCKTEDMVNVKHDSCKNDGCPSAANKKYKNYCAYCFQHLFPLDPLTFQIRCKTKELAVRDFINANYDGFNHDKILEYGGCDCLTRRRIDHRKLIGNTLLCVETDENQHKSYSKEDEEARYNDLLVNFTCKYIIIRFNPDSYVNKKGVKSNPYISARLEELKKEMDKQIKRIENNENADLLEVVHLYYDGYK